MPRGPEAATVPTPMLPVPSVPRRRRRPTLGRLRFLRPCWKPDAVTTLPTEALPASLRSPLVQVAPRPSGGSTSSPGLAGVDVRQWEVQFSDLVIQRGIGEGSYGRVRRADYNILPVHPATGGRRSGMPLRGAESATPRSAFTT